MDKAELAKYIDHTILRPDASSEDVRKVCREAREHGFASVCVNPSYVDLAASELADTDVGVCSVVGFPLGATAPEAKAFETTKAIESGADEIDMVANIGAVKSMDWDLVRRDIEAVVAASGGRALVKVIIEACLLDDNEKVRVCRTAQEAGADFVKTSTGFSTGGATEQDVKLMRETVGDNMGVKASGGIHTTEEALSMIRAGASRIGASNGVAIVSGLDS